MPVTAKLSREFYEKLGDDVANELVNWFNMVDLSYRSEIRELFEIHFSRFEAKLAELRAEVKGELDQRLPRMETRLILWMFGFWVGSIFATIGALIALRQLAR